MTAPDARNPGVALQPDWFVNTRINSPAAERRAASLPARRMPEGDHRTAWLVRALGCIDLTTLAGDDTPGHVQRLARQARRPLRGDLLSALGLQDAPPKVAAVCVYPTMVAAAVQALEGSGIPVAAVAAGFPAGLTPLPQRLAEIRHAVAEGAAEIDIVITRAHALTGDWPALYEEISAMREACGAAHLKVILASGDLRSLRVIFQASMVAMQAGADFIKTSTGKEEVNATLPVSLVMARAIRDYAARTGHRVGFKPAGGLRTVQHALHWLILMREELGLPWVQPEFFRLGASALLGNIEHALIQQVRRGADPARWLTLA